MPRQIFAITIRILIYAKWLQIIPKLSRINHQDRFVKGFFIILTER